MEKSFYACFTNSIEFHWQMNFCYCFVCKILIVSEEGLMAATSAFMK